MAVILSRIALVCVVLALWKALCIYLRSKRSRYMASLHPTEDALLISRLTNFVEFSFLTNKAVEFALFRTFAIPSISKILQSTHQFSPKSVTKRYDDTAILIQEFYVNHVDSPRGSLAIRRLNFIHSQYNITHEDYLYTLSLFILEPIRFSAKFGYRAWTEAEKTAHFIVWCDIGTRMAIPDIPQSLEDMDRFSREYEARKMMYADSNRVIGDATLDLMLSSAPSFLHPLVRRVIFALLDDRLVEAMGYPRQPHWMKWTAESVIKLFCGTLVRWFLPPRPLTRSTQRISLEEGEENKYKVHKVRYDVYKPGSYPNGYNICELGNAKAGELGKAGEGRLRLPFRATAPKRLN